MTRGTAVFLTVPVLFFLDGVAPAQAQVDAEAAQALAKRNDCFKCHAIDKAKKAPPYKRIAARLKTKPDGVETVIEHITSGHMVELDDGTQQNHRIVDTRDARELKNLAEWILSL
jgi:cytochrome c